MRFSLDPFTIALLSAVLLGAVLPVEGTAADVLGTVADIAIGLVFFLHGARLQREVVIAGIRHWRLHGFILVATFIVYPIIGLGATSVLPSSISAPLVTGILFLSLLPSTVQSSIALTSIAHGNVPGAVCSATASNLLGMFLTPAAVSLLLHQQGAGLSLEGISPILFQLLVPFIVGQVLQPWIGDFVRNRRVARSIVDRGAILLVVYLAFSAAIVADLWTRLSVTSLAIIIAVCVVMLVAIAAFNILGARFLRFSREDEITAVFCGSQKSLVTGIPIANVLFAGPDLGLIVLPLMLFHQIQLIGAAFVARQYAKRTEPARG